MNRGDSAACFARSVANSTGAAYYSPLNSTSSYSLTTPNFSFVQNRYVNDYVSKSHTPTKNGDDLSDRGQFTYAADRYGLQIDRLVVPGNFNPEVGFLPRTDFRRNYASGRFSPRPAQAKTIRKFYVEGSLNYTTDTSNHLESREALGAFRIEMQNSDAIHVEYFRDYEVLRRSFQVSDTPNAHPRALAWRLRHSHVYKKRSVHARHSIR